MRKTSDLVRRFLVCLLICLLVLSVSACGSGDRTAYNDGYTEGVEQGKQSGYDEGYLEGYNAGLSEGYDSGYDEGYDAGNESGSESGYIEGTEAVQTEDPSDGYGDLENAADPTDTAKLSDTDEIEADETNANYILNKNTHVFHYPWCSSVSQMKDSNKIYFRGTREEAIEQAIKNVKKIDPDDEYKQEFLELMEMVTGTATGTAWYE